MPPSNNTVSQRISDMAGDVLKQLLLCIQASELYKPLETRTGFVLSTRQLCDIKWTLVIKMCWYL